VIVHYGQAREEADALVAAIRASGGKAEGVSSDMAAADGAEKLAQWVRTIVGARLDILVASAGISKTTSIDRTTVADFDLSSQSISVHLSSWCSLLPILCEGSSVTVTSSLAARAAVGTLYAYAMTKGAVDTMVKHFAAALGSRGIRVNAVAPGVVQTDMSDFTKTDFGRDFTLNMQALKRLAVPEDTGDVIAFLASDDARWITGDIIHVDGGSKL
jgi:3-oxoacyl-[acyl-carrier protein] reductase